MEPDDLKHDERLYALFRAVERPAPSPHFADRTMKAVRNAPLPAGRRALRNPLAGLVGWAALIAAVAILSWALAATQPQFASALTRLVGIGIGVGVWSVQFAGAGFALSEVFTTTGLAVTRAVATREGSAGLMLIAAMGAFSLSALHRLLISEGSERGVSRWQEL